MARASASPTWSGPEGSSHNEPRLGRCQPLTPFPASGSRPLAQHLPDQDMTDALAALGWSAFEADQLGDADLGLTPARISSVNRRNVNAIGADGPLRLVADPGISTASFAAGTVKPR